MAAPSAQKSPRPSTCLTYNATSLITPTGVSIPVNAGDSLFALALGSGNWQVVSYTRANGQALAASSSGTDVPVRQTVLGGDSTSGAPSFLTTGSGLTPAFTSTKPLVLTFANGFGSSGAVDTVSSLTSGSSMAAITAGSTNYLYATYVSGSAVTWGATTTAPVYDWVAPTNTSGQYWFDPINYQMKLGNGSTWTQTNTVFVGEAVGGYTYSAATNSAAAPAMNSTWTNTLFIGQELTIANNAVIGQLGMYSTTAVTTAELYIMRRDSANNYTVMAKATGSHTGSGYEYFNLGYTVPSSGTYYIGIYWPNASGPFANTTSTNAYNSGASPLAVNGTVVMTGATEGSRAVSALVGYKTTTGTTVTSVTPYAFQGQYVGSWTNTLPGVGTVVSASDNLGTNLKTMVVEAKNLTADNGFTSGDLTVLSYVGATTVNATLTPRLQRNTSAFATGNAAAFYLINPTTGAYFTPTAASWAYRLRAKRSF